MDPAQQPDKHRSRPKWAIHAVRVNCPDVDPEAHRLDGRAHRACI
jgi:hypothetical protein